MNPTLFINALVRTSLEAGVLVLLVLAAQRVFRRQLPPQWACALWLLVVLRLLPISPGSSVSIFNWLPRWFEPPVAVLLPVVQSNTAPASPSAAIFLQGKAPAPSADGGPAGSLPAAASDVPGSAVEISATTDLPISEERWTLGRVLFALWLTGAVALGGYVACTSLVFARQFTRLPAIDDPEVRAVLRECCERLGVRRLPRISKSAGIESPGLYGLFRPRLLLPIDFTARFSPDELRFVFLHELAHVKRLDLPLNWLVTSLQVIHWFNPLVWLGFARWRVDREIACDARAIAAAGPDTNHAYGRTILRLLENITLPMSRPGLVGILETKRQLHRRMRMIAGYSDQTRPYTGLALIVTLGVAGLTDAQVDPVPTAPVVSSVTTVPVVSKPTAAPINPAPSPPPAPPERSTPIVPAAASAQPHATTPMEFVEWRGTMAGANVSVAYPSGWTARNANPTDGTNLVGGFQRFLSPTGSEMITVTSGIIARARRDTGPRPLRGEELLPELERIFAQTPTPEEYRVGQGLPPLVDFRFPEFDQNGEISGSLPTTFRKKEIIRTQPMRAAFDYDGPSGQQARMYFVPTAERMVAVAFIFRDPSPSGDKRQARAEMMDQVVRSLRTSVLPVPGQNSTVAPASASAAAPAMVFGAVATDPSAFPSVPRLVDGRDPLSGVNLNGERILFLVRASGSMLGETIEEATTRAGQTDAEKRNAPKWQRTMQILRWMLAALGPQQQFQIVYFNEDATPLLPVFRGRGSDWISAHDPVAAGLVLARLDNIVPQGGANLERAFALFSNQPPAGEPADNIVLITDGLPTRSDSIPTQGVVDEASRIRFFEVATKQLPPRVPVQTILLPLDGDPGAPGLYWELANATHGALLSPAGSWPALDQVPAVATPPSAPTPIGLPIGATHVAIVVDTSGSMRDPNRGGLWPIVIRKVEEVLNAHPQLRGVQLLDGDGRFILGRPRGNGKAAWLTDSPQLRDDIKRVLGRYNQDTKSNPVPGIYNAISLLHDGNDSNMKVTAYILGDEFTENAAPVIARLNELNPADENGQRWVTINAIGFPTTIRFKFSMGQTGVKFANLMRLVTQQHGGAFIALNDL